MWYAVADVSDTKRCDTCRVDKPEASFNKNRSKRDGLNSICRECSNARSRRYYKENHDKHIAVIRAQNRKRRAALKAIVADHLVSHPCVDCGESDPIVLEFDHVRGKKRDDVSRIISRGLAVTTLFDEIAKCDVRCANWPSPSDGQPTTGT